MYDIVLFLHSWLRWIVIVVAAIAVLRALVGWVGRRDWAPADDRLGLLFTVVLDVQLLLGLVLYLFLSPITTQALQDFGDIMSDSFGRYWAVEHIGLMVVALVLAHVGRALSRRAADAVRKHRIAAILFGLATLALLLAIPWPFFAYGRPLFRI